MAGTGLEFAVNTKGVQQAQTQISGLAGKFVGLQVAVQGVMSAMREGIKWVSESVDEYRSFEKKIREVSTLLERETLSSVHGLQAGIENLSMVYGKGVNDLTEGTYQIISAAFEVDEAMSLLNTSTKAGIAGLSDIATSVDVMTSILNSYGMEVSQASRISDELFQTIRRGKLRFEDLASAMGYITPIASNVGVEFREIAAALSTVTRMGLHVDMATRGLALGIQGIANPTAQAAEAAQKYRVDMSELALSVGGLEGFIKDLNKSTEKFGTQIVPELIRNMRSLRVFLALAGEEGVKGFMKDLDLLSESAGRTEEALSRMRKSAQMEADIASQQMAYINRRVGESWHDISIGWEKTKIFFGELLSGGDPFGAMGNFDERLSSIQETYDRMRTKGLGRDESVSDLLFGAVEEGGVESLGNKLETVMSDLEPSIKEWGRLTDELAVMDEHTDVFDKIESKLNAVDKDISFDNVENFLWEFKDEYPQLIDDIISDLDKSTDTYFNPGEGGGGFFENVIRGMETGLAEGEKLVGDFLKMIPVVKDYMPEKGYLEEHLDTQKALQKIDITGQLQKNIDFYQSEYHNMMVELQNDINEVITDKEEFKSIFDEASQAINKSRLNILKLTNEIEKLHKEVRKPYETYGGVLPESVWGEDEVLSGRLGHEIGITKMETSLDRSQRATQMAMKYGSDYINEYNENLEESIMTVYNYEESIDEATKTMDKYNEAIKENNVEMLELRISGMEKRHGLSRGEQKKMKDLELENAKSRLKIMKEEQKEKTDILDEEVEDARKRIQKHYDIRQYDLWAYSDLRDEIIKEMKDEYDYKTWLLENYETDLKEEYTKMTNAQNVLTAAIIWAGANIPDEFEKMFGKTTQDMLDDVNTKISDFITNWNKMPSSSEVVNKLGFSASIEQVLSEFEEEGEPDIGEGFAEIVKKTFPYVGETKERHETPSVTQPDNPCLNPMNPLYGTAFCENQGYQRGTQFVPRDMMTMVHRGEKIVPAGKNNKNNGNGNISVHIDPVNVNAEIYNHTDIEDLGSRIGQAIAANLVSGIESEYEVG